MTAPVHPTDLFHVGIVVANLEAAQKQLTDTLGLHWTQLLESEMPTRAADGMLKTVPMRVLYSIDAPHLELIQEVPDTIWVTNAHSNLHHIGFFGGALNSTSAALVATGCPLEITDWNAETAAPSTFAFHRNELNVRIEVVDTALREVMPMLWTNGAEQQ